MGGVAYCTPNIQEESIHREVSVLAMGLSSSLSSCDKAQLQGWIGNKLSSTQSYVWPLVGAEWGEVCSCLLFFPHREHVAGRIRVFDDGSGIDRGETNTLKCMFCKISEKRVC